MWLACIDLESVLIPELWPVAAQRLGLPQLRLTTRDISSKARLNRLRLSTLVQARVSVSGLLATLQDVRPLPGAAAFLDWLSARIPVVIVSDCFYPMAQPVIAHLGHPTLLAHPWSTHRGHLRALHSRLPGDTKAPAVRTFQRLGYRVVALGDSLNDLGMLRCADAAFWFRPSPAALARAPRLPVCTSYAQARRLIHARISA